MAGATSLSWMAGTAALGPSMAGRTLASMMAGKWLVGSFSAAGAAWGRIASGSAEGARNRGCTMAVLERLSETGGSGRKIVRVGGAPEAPESGRVSQCTPFHAGIRAPCGFGGAFANVFWSRFSRDPDCTYMCAMLLRICACIHAGAVVTALLKKLHEENCA